MAKFQAGESGNPNGRPKKGTALTDILKERLDAIELADKLIERANNGDVQAMKYIYDRIDGKPRESIDLDHHAEVEYKINAPPVFDEAYSENED